MPAISHVPVTGVRPVRRLPPAIMLLVGLLGALVLSCRGSADAATPGAAAVREASHHRGQPYVYGAAGPDRFDCSGFTLYVFSRFGKHLPHSAQSQYDTSRHVPRRAMRVGDLVFFGSPGNLYHVGIYAGNGQMWDAPRSGEAVRLRAIYSSSYLVARA